MKQSITQQQFEELNPKQKEKYFEWLYKTFGLEIDPTIATLVYEGRLPANGRIIGHLIRFLDEHMHGWWRIERATAHNAWRVNEEYEQADNEGNPELIDVLWEAVKTALNEIIPPASPSHSSHDQSPPTS